MVDQETANLDPLGMPFLIAKLVESFCGPEGKSKKNAQTFFQGLAERRDVNCRALIIQKLIVPHASTAANAQFFSELFFSDPNILIELSDATKLRCAALLMENAKKNGVVLPYSQLRNPCRELTRFAAVIGEIKVLEGYSNFANWVVDQVPVDPAFLADMKFAKSLRKRLVQKYIENAGSTDIAVSNPLAKALPFLDEPLAGVYDGKQSFELCAALVKAGRASAFEAMALANEKFESLPKIRRKADKFAGEHKDDAIRILERAKISEELDAFMKTFMTATGKDSGAEQTEAEQVVEE